MNYEFYQKAGTLLSGEAFHAAMQDLGAPDLGLATIEQFLTQAWSLAEFHELMADVGPFNAHLADGVLSCFADKTACVLGSDGETLHFS